MISNEQIARINELYRKQKTEGLSEEEKSRHTCAALHRCCKGKSRAQLDSIKKQRNLPIVVDITVIVMVIMLQPLQ